MHQSHTTLRTGDSPPSRENFWQQPKAMDMATTHQLSKQRDARSSPADSTDIMLPNIVITGAEDDYKLLRSEEQNITISHVQVAKPRYSYLSPP